MSLSRRNFMKTLGVGAAGMYAGSLISTRFRESLAFAAETSLPVDAVINLANNENPMGPGQVVLDAITEALGPEGAKAGRYPFGYFNPLRQAIAA
ncbi:MAG: twin-arginine translocation signal domain-containing protein, partial [Acidobacteriota bacterium]